MLSIIAPLALLATSVVADSVGSAIVVNSCDYDVYLTNVPGDSDVSTITKTLSAGGSYSQEWTELSNGAGWSIKLSEDSTLDDSNLMQYEYTWLDDGTIWYDLSEVNGNPWDGNWEITSDSSSCSPRQAAYRYATDDAYGEQSCDGSASITVTLCSGDSSSDSSSSSSSSSAVASSTTSSVASSSSAASSSAAAETTSFENKAAAPSAEVSSAAASSSSSSTAVAPSPTTFATSTSSFVTSTTSAETTVITQAPDNNIVTIVETEIVTEVAYTTFYKDPAHHWGRRQHADAHEKRAAKHNHDA